MPTNQALQSVLLFQHHQTTTPFAPVPSAATRLAQRKEESPVKEKEREQEQEDEEEEDEEEADDGEKH